MMSSISAPPSSPSSSLSPFHLNGVNPQKSLHKIQDAAQQKHADDRTGFTKTIRGNCQHVSSFEVLQGTRKPETAEEMVSAFVGNLMTELFENAFVSDDDDADNSLGESAGDDTFGKMFAMAASDALAKDGNLLQGYREILGKRFEKALPHKTTINLKV